MRTHAVFCRICLLAVLLLCGPSAWPQAENIGVKAAVDAAWKRSPEARALQARQDEILAAQESAQSWIAGSPEIGLSQSTDRWTDQNGVRETTLSIAAPLWLPAQRAARKSLAKMSADELDAQIAYLRLKIAGEVRERLWEVAAAREGLFVAQGHQEHLEDIVEEVNRRINAGDLARSDGILALQEVLSAKAEVAAAQIRVQESLARYRTLTGQVDTPLTIAESPASAMAEPHPRMLAAQAALQHAQASFNVVNRTRSEPPMIGIAWRREQDGFLAEASRNIEFSIQVPIGTSARNQPRETAARTQIAAAMAEAEQVETILRNDIALARQQLTISQQALETASSRAAMMREHTGLIKKAFQLGERGLADLLRSEALLHDAAMAERHHKVAVGLAQARLNQALGILP